eukprot:6748368-Pyramimonas_sp.AAC.1
MPNANGAPVRAAHGGLAGPRQIVGRAEKNSLAEKRCNLRRQPSWWSVICSVLCKKESSGPRVRLQKWPVPVPRIQVFGGSM